MVFVNSGSLTDGVVISMKSRPTYCVRGSQPQLSSRQSLTVSISDVSAMSRSILASGRVGERYESCSIPAGTFSVLMMVAPDYGAAVTFGRTNITIADSDYDVPPISLQPPFAINGKISLKTSGPMEVPSGISLSLEPVDRLPVFGEQLSCSVDSEGRFTFRSVFPGEYWARLSGLPAGSLCGVQDALNGPINITPNSELAVELAFDAGKISGRVVNRDDVSVHAGVVVACPDPIPAVVGSGRISVREPDQDGAYSFSLPPGDYLLFPFSELELNQGEELGFLSDNNRGAVRVSVASKGSQTVSARLIER